MGLLLGAIADDLTGATDLALTLAKEGMSVVQVIGVPDAGAPLPDADAIVIALKSRTMPPNDAIAESLQAAEALRAHGAGQYLFKYCSTFDSTDQGNIGPVAEALLDWQQADFTVACPAFPTNGRSIYQGHLFVGDVLLSDSSMRNHPLTPMQDANLVRVLARQCRPDSRVGLIPYTVVEDGVTAVRKAMDQLRQDGHRFAILDALNDTHLRTLGAALSDLELVTGGSGIAMGLPENFRQSGRLSAAVSDNSFPPGAGQTLILSGSCSAATQQQVARATAAMPALALDPLQISAGTQSAESVIAWIKQQPPGGPVLVYSTADPKSVEKAQAALGREAAAARIEDLFGTVAATLYRDGVSQFVVAGGETSGAVIQALGLQALHIGPEIDPGVPLTFTEQPRPTYCVLKSGNFGSPEFFSKAISAIQCGGQNPSH